MIHSTAWSYTIERKFYKMSVCQIMFRIFFLSTSEFSWYFHKIWHIWIPRFIKILLKNCINEPSYTRSALKLFLYFYPITILKARPLLFFFYLFSFYHNVLVNCLIVSSCTVWLHNTIRHVLRLSLIKWNAN